jgi:hypothetical protein
MTDAIQSGPIALRLHTADAPAHAAQLVEAVPPPGSVRQWVLTAALSVAVSTRLGPRVDARRAQRLRASAPRLLRHLWRYLLHPRWFAIGQDPGSAMSQGNRSGRKVAPMTGRVVVVTSASSGSPPVMRAVYWATVPRGSSREFPGAVGQTSYVNLTVRKTGRRPAFRMVTNHCLSGSRHRPKGRHG